MKRPILVCIGWFATVLTSNLAAAENIPGYAELEANRERLIEWVASNDSGIEFYAESAPASDAQKTDIAVIVPGIDLATANSVLSGPAAWCELMFLHINVKSCVYDDTEGAQWVRLYMGRKFYQHPEKAEAIELQFQSGVNADGVSWVTLTADEGPYGTSDYYIGLYVIDSGDDAYVQIRSSQKTGKAASSAASLYFKTLGRSKVGFSVVGYDDDGNPEYSRGEQAALERNIVRYLLAARIYMATHKLSDLAALRARMAPWYDATEKYAEQLHEVDRDDYLKDKEKEYRHQLEMQADANAR